MRSLATFLALLISLNFWGWHENYLGLGLGLAWLLLTSWLIGGRTGALASSRCERLVWGLLLTAAAVSIIGTILFYLNLFNAVTVSAITALLPWFGTGQSLGKTNKPANQPAAAVEKILTWFTATLYLATVIIIFLLINASGTNEAIRTPWSVVPIGVFVLYGLTALALVWLTRYLKHPLWLVPFYLLSFSVLVIIYPLGYGFDAFIHQASEKLLALTGTISPKPLYYLGQYTLVTFWAQNLNLSIEIIDAWLVPLLASLILPIATFNLVRHLKIDCRWHLLLSLTPLLFALAAFTYTTPQSLAYLWILTATLVLAARRLGAAVPARTPWILAGAALFTHPLAGLPFMGVLALWWLKDYGINLKNQRRWRWLATAGTALAVPIAFALLSWLKPSAASIKFSLDIWANLSQLSNSLAAHLPFLPRYVDLPDAIYLWGRPLTFGFVILAALGYWLARKKYKSLSFMAEVALLPAIGYVILALFANFPNLPPNEQDFYTIRLWDITLLLLWPLVLLGIYWLAKKITGHWRHNFTWLIAGSLLLTASFYLTYPRFDIYHHDTAYNTTTHDIAAVKLVDEQAEGAPYVVLANQAVSAAAVREFGFARYYGNHFYYPLPTGTNLLYQVYLNAAERGLPTRDIISRAAELGVSQVFLILNRYWADYDALQAMAQTEADAWWEVAQGRLTVYRYDF